MLFSSAYATMMGVLPALITDKTAVISDELNHSCIINAIALARPAEKHIYRHLDMGELEHRLDDAQPKLHARHRRDRRHLQHARRPRAARPHRRAGAPIRSAPSRKM